MPEEVLFKIEQNLSRAEIAAYLRDVANRLVDEGKLSLSAGDQRFDADLPSRLTFEVKAERETSRDGGNPELSIEFELEWKEGESGEAGELEIG